MQTQTDWNCRVEFFFKTKPDALNAKEVLESESDDSFRKSQTQWMVNQNRLTAQINAQDKAAWTSQVHGTLKSVALIQRLQKIKQNQK